MLFIIFLILNTGSLSYLTVYSASNPKELKGSIITLALIIASYLFLGITLAITGFYFVSEYLVEKKITLDSF